MSHDSAKTPRRRRHDANLEKILDAAMRMVAEGGLESLSMTRLAEAVDYTPGALYRYFDSKNALLSMLVARILEGVRATLDDCVAQLPSRSSPIARVFALGHGYGTFAREQPYRFGLLAMTMAVPHVLLHEPADANPVVHLIVAALQPLIEALAAATAAGLLAPGDNAERTICVFALLQGVLQLHKQARYAPEILDVERLATRGIRSLLVGWGAKSRVVDAAIARVAPLPRSSRLHGGAS